MSADVEVTIRKMWTVVEEINTAAGRTDPSGPLTKVAVAAVIANPFAGQGFVGDLSRLVEGSAALGSQLGEQMTLMLSGVVESYGKGGVVGTAGEQEHVNACLTSAFGNALRQAVGGAEAWISSVTKVGSPGATVDIPLAFKDEIWVRSHYDAIEVRVSDAPAPDEIVVVAAGANRSRLNARLGGMSKDEATGVRQ